MKYFIAFISHMQIIFLLRKNEEPRFSEALHKKDSVYYTVVLCFTEFFSLRFCTNNVTADIAAIANPNTRK